MTQKKLSQSTGQDYQEIFAEIGRSGCATSKETAKTAKMGADELESLDLDGSKLRKKASHFAITIIKSTPAVRPYGQLSTFT